MFVGSTASGKTTIGRRVAELLGIPCADLDDLITQRYGSLQAIFAAGGEQEFRRREAAAIAEALSCSPGRFVLSCGGGALSTPQTRPLLARTTVVWLETDLETVLPRLQARTGRPLLRGDLAGKWSALDRERRPVFQAVADLRVDARGKSVDELATLIAKELNRRPAEPPIDAPDAETLAP